MAEAWGIAGWFDLSARARVEVAGPDAVRFLNNLCTNDLARLPDGGACEAGLCNAKGGMVDFGVVLKRGERLLIDAEPGRAAPLLKHLDRYHIREKLALADRSAETCCFHLFGADAEERLRSLGAEIPPELRSAETALAGTAATVLRRSRTPQPGFDAFAAASAAAGLSVAFGAGEISAAQATGLRVQAGLPAFGADLPEGTLPQELDRTAQAISFTKGCYIGQETVARLDAYGHVNKILRGLELAAPAEPGTPILHAGKEVGKLGTVAPGPDGVWRALAIVRTAAAAPDAAVTVGGLPARISALPFG